MTYCDLTDVRKKSLTPPSGKGAVIGQQRNHELLTTEDNSSHEEGELSLKTDKLQHNGHGTEVKLDKTVDRHSYSDDTSKSRFRSLIASFLPECFDVVFHIHAGDLLR